VSAATKLRARVVYDVGTARFVGEVVDAEGNLVRSFHRNEWDDAMRTAKEWIADERSS
jgi:hypothetical protein